MNLGMKNYLMMLVCCIMFCSMSACSDSNNENDSKNPPEQPDNIPGNENTTADGKITNLPNDLSNLWGQGSTDEWDGTTDISWYDKDKTAFQLTSAEQLAGLAELVNSGTTFARKTVKLTVNVILNKTIKFDTEGKVTNASELKKWTPIGRIPYHDNDGHKESFRGCFDGDNHIISGLYINTTEDYQGLFGGVCNLYENFNVVIKNVGIVSSYIRGGRNVAAIVSGNWTYNKCIIKIENCFNTGTIIGEEETRGIGQATTIMHCFNRGAIKCEKYGNSYGIGSASSISHCYNTGKISSVHACYGIGKALVENYTIKVSNSYNMGELEGSEIYYAGDKTCATLYQEEKRKIYKTGETLFRDNAGKLYYHDPSGTLSITKPKNYSTLLECLNYNLREDLLIWKIDPAKNNGYPIFIE